MGSALASRVKDLRLRKNWTQETLAERSGVSLASYKRFEATGKASFELVLKVAQALSRLQEFDTLLLPPAAESIEELEKLIAPQTRKRGRN